MVDLDLEDNILERIEPITIEAELLKELVACWHGVGDPACVLRL